MKSSLPDNDGHPPLPFEPSLSEVHRSVEVPYHSGRLRQLWAFVGPGLLVAVGYMDPGNWATDLAGGARYGYLLLSVVFISNCLAILLQHLALKLGIVTGTDLAQACRLHYSKTTSFILWILCELAIVACDLAEVIGSAVALNLLFGIPLVAGVFITALDVMLILMLHQRGFRAIESVVASLIFIVGASFAYELAVAQPALRDVIQGFIPRATIITDPEALYIAIGILGATVMPHNLYLHSSIVQTRAYRQDAPGKQTAIRFATIDSTLSLLCAFFINAAILVLSARAFHGTQHSGVADINDAFKLLSPVLGDSLASTVFAIALLASGQNSTITGTMAGQIVMEGFLQLRLRPWVRRLITRLIAIVPAAIVAAVYGERGSGELLVLSQVVLSLQLSFAIFPLVQFTSSATKMGEFRNGVLLTAAAWGVALLIAGLNIYLLCSTVMTWWVP